MSGRTNRCNRRNWVIGAAIGTGMAVAAFSITGASEDGHDREPAEPYGDPATGVYEMPDAALESLRMATEEFADPAAAEAAGRVDLELCFDQMGDHFADPATFGDGVLDAADPEALVYADVDGTSTLVAVEWVSTSPGQVLGIPLHLNHDLDVWVLHAWIGLDNPSGMHADHNPNVGACPA